MKIAAILLVPHPEHVDALLHCGVCGARPPMAQFDHFLHEWTPLDEKGRRWMADSAQPKALVLAYKGKPVREGVDRAQAVRDEAVGAQRDGGIHFYVERLFIDQLNPDIFSTDHIMKACGSLGAIVCVDSDGKEIAP